MHIISEKQVHSSLSFEQLIPLLKSTFSNDFHMPQRQVFHLDDTHQTNDAFALLPSWNKDVIGTKAFTYFPENAGQEMLQSLYSKIMLFKRETGEPLALVDGTSITYWRTAAVSALASQLLSKKDSKNFVLFGTGNLAPFLIRAHLAVRQLTQVTIVARTPAKAEQLIENISCEYPNVVFKVSHSLEEDIRWADIICCATGSPEPLFDGNWLISGTHIDCLGNHNSEQRECDTNTITRSRVYVDSRINNLAEAGELLIPISQGTFSPSAIVGELAEICKQPSLLRQSDNEITLFKSVGTAISDLVTAHYVYQQQS